MELITILSTIILIATISTFILSIGAYILYKIRSRRELKPILNSAGPTKAELVTVPVVEDYEKLREQVGRTSTPRTNFANSGRESDRIDRRFSNVNEKPKHEKTSSSRFVKYSSSTYNADRENSTEGLQWK